MGTLPDSNVPIYFLEHNRYFDRPYIYGPPGQSYSDNLERFTFLSRGSLELCKALGFVPDIVHANDWQTALVPVYINTVEWAKPLHGAASVYTIHNLAYQGVWRGGALFITGLGREHYNPREFEHFGDDEPDQGGALPQHAADHREPDLRAGDPDLRPRLWSRRRALRAQHPISSASSTASTSRNGTPSPIPHSPPSSAGPTSPARRRARRPLQAEAGLPVRADVPLFGLVGRLTLAERCRCPGARAARPPRSGLAVRAARHAAIPTPSATSATRRRSARRPVPRLHRVQQRRSLTASRRAPILSHALAFRALRAQPAVQPALRHAAHRARDRAASPTLWRSTTKPLPRAPVSSSTISRRVRSTT